MAPGTKGLRMSYQHAVVWLDHLKATVIDFSIDDQHVQFVASATENRQVHRKSGPMGSGKAREDHHFFDDVVAAIGNAREILVCGPGTAKNEFRKDLEKRHAAVARLVVGVESADHPSAEQLLAHARTYFKRYAALKGTV